jgi:vitamin K-dependent gamma-carboxylase
MATSTLIALRARMREPIDASSIAAFRVVFGLLVLVATVRFIASGWIAEYYEMPTHFFTYYGFGWVKPWPGTGMYIHFGAMAVLAAMIVVGLFTRFATIGFGVLFAYAHLIDKTNYLNHYYLLICVCLVMSLLPMGSTWSLDARLWPRLARTHVPLWVLWTLRAQIAIVYVFAGLAKLKYDWVVEAQPMSIWLSANTDFPIVGRLFDQPWLAYAFSYAGILFDLSIVPLLLWRRSRPFAYVAVIVFHLVTARLFHLGMFPWIMMASSLVFLPEGWPRRLLGRPPATVGPMRPLRGMRVVTGVLAAYFVLQIALPLRHFAYPGDVCWSEQGFRFAWHVMVMEKDGSVVLHVREPATDRRWDVRPGDYLTRYQAKMMAPQPDMILALAHIVAADFRSRGVRDPIVTADAFVSLNGHRRARLIDPTVDLSRESDGVAGKAWILPRPTDDSAPTLSVRTTP